MKKFIFMSGSGKTILQRIIGFIGGGIIFLNFAVFELPDGFPVWVYVPLAVIGGYIALIALVSLIRLLVICNSERHTIACGECSSMSWVKSVSDFRAILLTPNENCVLLEDFRFLSYWRLEFSSFKQAEHRARQLAVAT